MSNNNTGIPLDALKSLVNANGKHMDANQPNASKEEQALILNGAELLDYEEAMPTLWEPYFPAGSLVAVTGIPDCGKSQFCRQLALSIAGGKETFLGTKLHLKHRSVIYVASEDSPVHVKWGLLRQFRNLDVSQEEIKKLRFVFPRGESLRDVIVRLDTMLAVKPADLLVIDSFGDLFEGEQNNNSDMRKNTARWGNLAAKHGCTILFIHHLNKGSYRDTPKQEGIAGAGAFSQKCRTTVCLSRSEGNNMHLSVTKGNYIPDDVKKNALQLVFDESIMLFSSTGSQIGMNEVKGKKPSCVNIDWEFFKKIGSSIELAELRDLLIKREKISRSLAYDYVKDAQRRGILYKVPSGKGELVIWGKRPTHETPNS